MCLFGECYGNAVLDHHSLGVFGGFAVSAPCHGSGNALDCDLCHSGNDTGTEVIFVLRGQTGVLDRFCDSVDSVVAVSCELVGSLTVVGCLICGNELLDVILGRIGGERSEKHYALSVGRIGDLGKQTVKTVAAEADHSVKSLCLGCLSEYLGGVSGVDGHEYQVCAGILDSGDLSGEVGVGGFGKGLDSDYFNAELLAFGIKGIVKTLAVVVTAVVNDGNLSGKTVVLDVLGGSSTL